MRKPESPVDPRNFTKMKRSTFFRVVSLYKLSSVEVLSLIIAFHLINLISIKYSNIFRDHGLAPE